MLDKRKAEHEAKTLQVKRRNDMNEEKTEKYEKLFKNALAKMRQQINAFLDDHPAMQIFYKKVY